MATDFAIADVLEWARTKPAEERYSYCDSTRCALAQFGKATGRPELTGPSGTAFLEAHDELRGAFCGPGQDTFGRLVRELEALVPAAQITDTWTKVDAYLTEQVVA